MQDLQEVTQDLHYENFRSDRLKRGGRLSSHGYVLPLSPAYVPVGQRPRPPCRVLQSTPPAAVSADEEDEGGWWVEPNMTVGCVT